MPRHCFSPVAAPIGNFVADKGNIRALSSRFSKLNAYASPKLSLPFSNQKFTVAEFNFQANARNNICAIILSE